MRSDDQHDWGGIQVQQPQGQQQWSGVLAPNGQQAHGIISQHPNDPFPHLRESLAPEYAELAPEQIEDLIEQTFGPEISAEQFEEIFGAIGRAARDVGRAVGGVARDVGQFAQKAAPVVGGVLPGIAQGAMAGSALGPFGMLGGAILGGAGSALAQHGKGPLRDIGKAVGTGLNVAGMISPAGRMGGVVSGLAKGGLGGLLQGGLGALGGGGGAGGVLQGILGGGGAGGLGQVAQTALGALGGPAGAVGGAPATGIAQTGPGALDRLGRGTPAAGQLINLLGSREMKRALQAMMLSPIGRQSVPVAGTPVPVGAFANLLGTVANQAQAEFNAMLGPQPEGFPEYLVESTGEFRCDPVDPAQRAEVLWQMLQQSAAFESIEAAEAEEAAEAYDEMDEIEALDQEEIEEEQYYDALELAEMEEES